MKAINYFTQKITALALLLSLFSCGGKETAAVNSQSADGNTKITVSGTKSFGDPWQTTIKINAFKEEQQVLTEIFAGDLNEKNVKFSWTDDTHCLITIAQQDDTKRTFAVEATESKISLREQ